MKVVSVHQPAYIPWLGYFHKILLSDVFVYLDTVQFEKNSFINRNKILGANGPFWLTVPVKTKGHTDKTLMDLEINEDRWQVKHIKSIELNYMKTPFFSEVFPKVKDVLLKAGSSFADFTYMMLEMFTNGLGIDTEIVRSSDLKVTGNKSELVKNIVKSLEGRIYVSGKLGKGYLNLEEFKNERINVYFQDYKLNEYQQNSKVFYPALSVVDSLMNTGWEKTRKIILDNNVTKEKLQGGVYEVE